MTQASPKKSKETLTIKTSAAATSTLGTSVLETSVLETSAPTQLEISQDVLYGVAQLAAEQVAGLTPASPPARMGELLTGRRAKGVVSSRDAEGLTIAVRVRYGLAIPKVAAELRRSLREAVASMTGMIVRSVNVTVYAVDFPEPEGSNREGRSSIGAGRG